MRKVKKTILSFGVVVFMLSLFSTTVLSAPNSPNTGGVTEYLDYWFVGWVQSQPCFYENGNHALNGYLRFQNGADGDTGRLYTESGKGFNDCTIYERKHTYRDTLNPKAPPVTFNYGHTWIPAGWNWPTPWSLPEVDM